MSALSNRIKMKSLRVGVLFMGVANGLTPSSPSHKPPQSRRLVLSTLATAALASLVVPSVARAAETESSSGIKRKYQR